MENDRLMALMNGKDPEEKQPKFLWLCIAVPLVLIAAFIYFNYDSPAGKARAEKALDEYIAATYTTELDGFVKSEGLAPYSESNVMGDKAVAYGYHYTKPEKGWGNIFIWADIEGNIVYDGYKEWYLTGGFNFERYQDEYYAGAYDLKQRLYAHIVNQKFFSVLDELGVSQHLESRQTGLGFGNRMISPQLDPDKDYDINRLAQEYGSMMIYLKSARATEEDFIKFAAFSADWLAQQDVYFNKLTFFLRPAKMEDVRNIHAVITMDELHSDDFETIIKEKAIAYTQQQYEADGKSASSVDEWTEEYMMEFDVQVSHELF